MKQYSMMNKFGATLALGAALLVGGAYVMAQKETEPQPASIATARELSSVFRDVTNEVLPSVVSIRTTSTHQLTQRATPFDKFFEQQKYPREQRRQGQGSGFIISDTGLVVTNSHVVQDADKIVAHLNDGRQIEATIAGFDPRSDVAVIQLTETDNLKPARLGNSDDVQVGDWVLAMGSPFGLEMSVTAGIISAKGRGPGINDREDYLQTDAAINPGNSGGPLVNINGEIIGINAAISSRSGGYDGIGFTIPINMANFSIDQIVDHGTVKRAFLGVGIQSMNRALSNAFGTSTATGVLITKVQPGSPAEKSGLRQGDIITEFNGQKVTNERNLQGLVEVLRPEKAYPMIIERDGGKETIEVTLGEMPDNYSTASFEGDKPEEPAAEETKQEELTELGVEVQDLNEDFYEQFGLKVTSGIVITAVDPDGPAANAGLSPGMVISQVGSKEVKTVEELKDVLKNANLEKGIALLINGSRFVPIKK
ncbi:MAG: Do family serine endopeptidase [Planctomycetaceae bacterium]